MSGIKLNKQQTKNVISLYRKYSCLWDPRSASYKRNDLRKKSWEKLAYQLDSPVDEAKKKIKYLRTAYLSEKKKVDKLKKNGDNYEPNLFYYNEFYFLDGIVQHRKFPSFEENHCSEVDETSNLKNNLTVEEDEEEQEEEEEEHYDTEMKINDAKKMIDFEEINCIAEDETNNTNKRAREEEFHSTKKKIRVQENHNKNNNIRVTYNSDRQLDLEERRFAFEREKALRELDLREKEIEKDERLKVLEIESKERITMKELEYKYTYFNQE